MSTQEINPSGSGGGGSGTVTSVDGSGGTTGLTLTGGPITTAGTLTLGGTLAIASGGTGQVTAAAAFGALSPLTTKGDVLGYSTLNARIPVGTNGQVLTADSAQALGLKWATPTTGTVTSVSGTANRITSTGGATPVIDISAAYVGQSSITTLGTITTGVWTGTTIAIANGGTGQVTANAAFNALSPLTTKGDVIGFSTANARLAVGSDGQVLTADAASTLGVKWSTPTADPVGANPTGTIGLATVNGSALTFLRSDGAPPLSQAIAPTWTGAHVFGTAATPVTINKSAVAGLVLRGTDNTSAVSLFMGTSSNAGKLYLGIDSSVGGFFTGSLAYANFLGTDIATAVQFSTNSSVRQTIASTGSSTFTCGVRTSGSASYFAIQTPADTTLAASTEAVGMQFGGDASLATVTRQFATGALAMQRSAVFVAPTLAFVGASTVSVASTVNITNTPIAGTNATITFPYALTWTGVVGVTPISGTNTAGNDLNMLTGLGTGTAASGSFSLKVSPSAATGVSGTAYTTPIEMLRVAGSNGVITMGDVNNVYANGLINIYHGSGFSGQGLNLRNSGANTGGSAAVNFISSGTSVANIMGSGAFQTFTIGGRPSIVFGNSAGTNVMVMAHLTTSPSAAVLGYAASVNTATVNPVVTWREISTSTVTTPIFQVRCLADTTLTASTEAIGNAFGGNGTYATVTRQWATGALATQRENIFVAPTYAFVGASTITTASTVSISGAPIAGTNATVTNGYALAIESGNIGLLSANNIVLDATTGTKIGTATSQKLGFWNATPIIQPASANQTALTDSTTGTPSTTLVDVGVVFSQSAINNNFASVAVLLNSLRTALVNSGLIKGAA